MGQYNELVTIHDKKNKQVIGHRNGNPEGLRQNVTFSKNSYGDERKETGVMESLGVRAHSYSPPSVTGLGGS
jgi:hypothetical protein